MIDLSRFLPGLNIATDLLPQFLDLLASKVPPELQTLWQAEREKIEAGVASGRLDIAASLNNGFLAITAGRGEPGHHSPHAG